MTLDIEWVEAVPEIPRLAENIATAFHQLEIIHRELAEYGVALMLREQAFAWAALARRWEEKATIAGGGGLN